MVTATRTDVSVRKKVRVNGEHTLTDVARTVCGDARLAALLGDLNPGLPRVGRLLAGTVVVCPAPVEAQAFARAMGFALGFDPKSANGTGARRKWAAHQGAPRAPVVDGDAAALARSLVDRGVTLSEAARRIARSCDEGAVRALASSTEAALARVGREAELCQLLPKATRRLAAVRGLLDATLRPAGIGALVEALARAPEEAAGALQACAVAAPLRAALVDDAPRVAALLAQAKAASAVDRALVDLAAIDDAAVRAVAAALVEGLEPLAPARWDVVALRPELEALQKHAEMLRTALQQAEAGLGRASVAVVRSVALGLDGAQLPRPWPLLAGVCRSVHALLAAAPVTAADLGLGGLVNVRPASGPVRAASLQARAAVCARAVDEGDALAARLAPVVMELFALVRPAPAVDGGRQSAQSARRRAAFEQAVTTTVTVDGAAVSAAVAALAERARLGQGAVLTRAHVAGLVEIGHALGGSLTVHRRPMSALGRALVLMAMGMDREIGHAVLRQTGREALAVAAVRHAGLILSAAGCRM